MGSIPYDVENSQRGSCWAGEHDQHTLLEPIPTAPPPDIDWLQVMLDQANAVKSSDSTTYSYLMRAITHCEELERELRRSLVQLEEVRDALRRAQRKQNSTEETPHAEH